MLDVMSMCQFLTMASEMLRVVRENGGSMKYALPPESGHR